MEWKFEKTSTQTGAATRAPAGTGIDPTGNAKRGQAAELLDADIKAGYVRGVAGVRRPDPEQRAAEEARVRARVHDALRAAGVPLPRVVFGQLATKGVFKRQSWTLFINAARFHDEAERVALLGTVYHEARHAEQFFDALRVAVALQPNASAPALAKWIRSKGETPPPMRVIEAARRRPLTRGESDKWFRLYFGQDAETYRNTQFEVKIARMRVADMKQERKRLLDRQAMGYPITKAMRARFKERRKQAQAELIKADAAYRKLTDEKEAHDLGDAVIEDLETLP